jgi:hypothetical protein
MCGCEVYLFFVLQQLAWIVTPTLRHQLGLQLVFQFLVIKSMSVQYNPPLYHLCPSRAPDYGTPLLHLPQLQLHSSKMEDITQKNQERMAKCS